MRNNDEPAFPVNTSNSDTAGSCFPSAGMTLRDYFAAKVLTGLASAYHEHWTSERVAEIAYELADKMLVERAK